MLFALLALAAVMQPMVVFASEIHDAAHETLPGQAQHESHGHDHDEPDMPADPVDRSDHWHVLMHFGHCCGHGIALLPMSFAFDAATAPALLPRTDSPRPPSAESSRLLRPPIHG